MNKKMLITVFVSVCALVSRAQTAYYRDSSGRLTGSVTTDGNGKTTYRDGSGRIIGTRTVR